MEQPFFSNEAEAFSALSEKISLPVCAKQIEQLVCHLGSMRNPTLTDTVNSSNVMDISIMMQAVKLLECYPIHKALLIGENVIFNSFFHSLLDMLAKRNIDISLYTELPILKAAGYTDVPAMLAAHKVHVLAHLPALDERDTGSWGGTEAMKRSIAALQHLNSLGYGLEPDLPLTLIYFCPKEEENPEKYKPENIASWVEERLAATVNKVKVLNARPGLGMGEAADEAAYLARLSRFYQAINSDNLEKISCRHSLCLTWNGIFYDCATNAILERGLLGSVPRHILSYNEVLNKREINISAHCLACLASSGSTLVED